jgi:hypothetical protein
VRKRQLQRASGGFLAEAGWLSWLKKNAPTTHGCIVGAGCDMEMSRRGA